MDQLSAHDPRRIGTFEVLGRLGAGGMGLVYLGRSSAGRRVAIKTVRAELAEDQLFRVRFAREIAAARTVSGFYTAAVVDADADAPVPWLATAYIPAPSLEDLVGECGPLPVEAVRWLAAGIAEALQSIHAAGLVHRDLKPSNVLVTEDGPRVIDFGIAAGVSHTRLTMTNVAVGTPAYMSPEQARDSRSVSGASDVFSLGSLLVFAATGHAPYHGGNPVETVFMLLREAPDLSGVPVELAPLIKACMRPAPERRPTPAQIAAELGPHLFASGEVDDDSREWLPPAAVALIDAKRGRRPAAPAPVAQPRPPQGQEPERPPGRHKRPTSGGHPAPGDQPAAPSPHLTPGQPPAYPPAYPGTGDRLTPDQAAAGAQGPGQSGYPGAAGSGQAPSGPGASGNAGAHPAAPAGYPGTAGQGGGNAGGSAAAGAQGPGQSGYPGAAGQGAGSAGNGPHGGSAAAGAQGPGQNGYPGAAGQGAGNAGNGPHGGSAAAGAQGPGQNGYPGAAGQSAGNAGGSAAAGAQGSGQGGAYPGAAGAGGEGVRLGGVGRPIGPGVRVEAGATEEPVAPPTTGWVRRGAGAPEASPAPAAPSASAAESGWRPWRFRMQHDVWGAPVVAEGALYLASFEVHAFDIATGRRRFKSRDVAWAMAHADGRVHAADGQNLFTLQGTDGTERWRAVLPGWTYSLDAAGGVLVAGTRGGGVHVRSAIDGSELWTVADAQQQYENPACGPCVLGDAVYYYGEGRLHAQELTSGQRQWSYPVGEDVPSRPLLHARTLYVATGAGVVALDEATGHERWRFDAPAVLFTSPVTSGQFVYVADYLGSVFALDAVTGALGWSAQTGRRQGADKVVVTDGIALVGAGDTLFAFDAALGEERWRYSARGELAGAPAAADGLVHVGSRDRSLHTLDLTTGRLRWKLDTGGEIAGSPVAADGRVFACSKDHCVYALDAQLGTATGAAVNS